MSGTSKPEEAGTGADAEREAGDTKPVVLLVDDDEAVVEAYTMWLDDEYETVSACGGEEALEKMSDDVDVALLDRRMPRCSGDEVLEEIRAQGYDCRVAMVTAVNPDFDILEMGFDTYLTKPVDAVEIHEAVEQLVAVSAYEDHVAEQFALAQKHATLTAELSTTELQNDAEFQELESRLEQLRAESGGTVSDLSATQFESVMHDLPGEEKST